MSVPSEHSNRATRKVQRRVLTKIRQTEIFSRNFLPMGEGTGYAPPTLLGDSTSSAIISRPRRQNRYWCVQGSSTLFTDISIRRFSTTSVPSLWTLWKGLDVPGLRQVNNHRNPSSPASTLGNSVDHGLGMWLQISRSSPMRRSTSPSWVSCSA